MNESNDSNTQKYQVAGMTCLHCVRSVTEELSSVSGVTAVDVNLESGEVTLSADPQPSLDVVQAAIEEAGYTLVS